MGKALSGELSCTWTNLVMFRMVEFMLSSSQNYSPLCDEDLPYNYIEDTWYIMACCGQSDSLREDWVEHCVRGLL